MPNLRLKIECVEKAIGEWNDLGLIIEEAFERDGDYLFNCKSRRYDSITQIRLARDGKVGSLGVPVWKLGRLIPRHGISDMSVTATSIRELKTMLRLIQMQFYGPDKTKTI